MPQKFTYLYPCLSPSCLPSGSALLGCRVRVMCTHRQLRRSGVLGAAWCVVGAVFAIYTLWKNSAVTVQGRSLPRLVWDNWFLLLWIAGLISIGAASVRRFLIEREVLRDGELAPGVLTDWSKVRYGISIRYQFWTSSGQRFEGSGKVNSSRDLEASDGIFPVFYLSHQPKSNLALCCTDLRITGVDAHCEQSGGKSASRTSWY